MFMERKRTNIPAWITRRVERGAALLDRQERSPDRPWYWRVNTGTLNTADPERCIVAQTCGDYLLGLKSLGLRTWGIGFRVPRRYGFDYVYARNRHRFNKAWRIVIDQRRTVDGMMMDRRLIRRGRGM